MFGNFSTLCNKGLNLYIKVLKSNNHHIIFLTYLPKELSKRTYSDNLSTFSSKHEEEYVFKNIRSSRPEVYYKKTVLKSF